MLPTNSKTNTNLECVPTLLVPNGCRRARTSEQIDLGQYDPMMGEGPKYIMNSVYPQGAIEFQAAPTGSRFPLRYHSTVIVCDPNARTPTNISMVGPGFFQNPELYQFFIYHQSACVPPTPSAPVPTFTIQAISYPTFTDSGLWVGNPTLINFTMPMGTCTTKVTFPLALTSCNPAGASVNVYPVKSSCQPANSPLVEINYKYSVCAPDVISGQGEGLMYLGCTPSFSSK